MNLKPFVLCARIVLLLVALVVVSGVCVPSAAADEAFDRESLTIKDSLLLKSGARLRGRFVSESREDGRKMIIFELVDGGVLKLDQSKLITKLYKASDADKEYNQRIETMEDTAEAHWEACKWCIDQKSGRLRYKKQIQFHRERIMELDPNDNKVKQLLGYEYIKKEGRWVPKAEYWASMGYERKGTRLAPMLQRVVSGKAEESRMVLGSRKSAFKRWKGLIRKNTYGREALLNELFQICDADAIGIILKDAEKEKNRELNSLYVEAFGRVPTANAMTGLVYFYMEDNSDRALTLLGQEHYSQEQAAAMLGRFLKEKGNNVVRVRRAAFAIGELNGQNMILPLVDALVTTHQVAPGKQAGRMNLSRDASGGVGGLTTGGKTAPVKRSFENVQSVDALRKITGQDFGYDSKPWIEWYVKNHTLHDIELRGPRRR